MKTDEIANIIDGYARLTRAVEAVLEDKSFIDENDRWLPRMWSSDIDHMDVNTSDQTLVGVGTVYTMQTGGSTEYVHFIIPLDTLRQWL